MSQDPVFVNLGVDRRTGRILADPQLLNSYVYSRGNPLIIKDDGGEFANVIIGAGGAMAAQYLYDVHSNIQANGFSASAFYRDLSSPETYAVRAGQGALIAGTGGLAAYAGLGLLGQAAAVGAASGATGAAAGRYLGEPVTGQSVLTDTIFGAATYGVLGLVPGVRSSTEFGTQSFRTGATLCDTHKSCC